MKKRKSQYSEEFKQDAVNYYYSSGKTMKEAAYGQEKLLSRRRSNLNSSI